MAFADVVFPLQLSRGTSGGTGFRTIVERSDSGFQRRATNWKPGTSGGRWDLAQSVQSEADVALLINFLRCMNGPATAFRFLAPEDYSTRDSHMGLPNPTVPTHRSPLGGVPDGTLTVFQMQKLYEHVDSGLTFLRDITKPIGTHHDADLAQLTIYGGGFPLWFNGVNQTPGFDVTVEYDTGKVRIENNATGGGVPPGSTLEWSGTYHTPVTFAPELDDGPDIRWVDADQFDVGNLSVVEVPKFYAESHEQLFGGGSHTYVAIGTIKNFAFNEGYHLRVNTSFAPGIIRMPDPNNTFTSNVSSGGPHALIEVISGSNPCSIVNSASQFITTLQPGESTELWVTGQLTSGQTPPTRQWFAR